MIISYEIRELVRERYRRRCGYCGVHENDAGSKLEVDHFKPRAFGGTEELENLVYCCAACNKFKGDFWPSGNSPPNSRRLLHPLNDSLHEHLIEDHEGRLIALSDTGTVHIEKLRLNRPQLLAFRKKRRIEREIYDEIAGALTTSKTLGGKESELADSLSKAFAQLERLQND